jgi:hypothetical protein
MPPSTHFHLHQYLQRRILQHGQFLSIWGWNSSLLPVVLHCDGQKDVPVQNHSAASTVFSAISWCCAWCEEGLLCRRSELVTVVGCLLPAVSVPSKRFIRSTSDPL